MSSNQVDLFKNNFNIKWEGILRKSLKLICTNDSFVELRKYPVHMKTLF